MKLGDKIWIEGSTRAIIESLENGKVLLASDFSGHTVYRADSPEDEAKIRAENERLNKEVNARWDELYAQAFPGKARTKSQRIIQAPIR